MHKNNSPYSAAFTGGGFLFEETNVLLPLLQAENSDALLREEKINNNLLHINAESSRSRIMAEVIRRYASMPASFWKDYQEMSEQDKPAALFYVILKTYKICFDFQVNVIMRKWKGISKSVDIVDMMMAINEIAANDEFVDSWSDKTKHKVVSAYLTILRRIGMLDMENRLKPLRCSNFSYYIAQGEPWFLEASLLQQYEIESIRKSIL